MIAGASRRWPIGVILRWLAGYKETPMVETDAVRWVAAARLQLEEVSHALQRGDAIEYGPELQRALEQLDDETRQLARALRARRDGRLQAAL